MKDNKSIDGLKPRSAKKTATTNLSNKKPKNAKSIKVHTDTKQPIISDDAIEITVNTDTTHNTTKTATVDDFLKPVQAFDFDSATKELTASTQSQDSIKDIKSQSITKSAKKSKKNKPKSSKKISTARIVISSILLVIVIALIGIVLWFILWGNDVIAKITGGQGTVFDLFTFVDETYEPLKTDANGRTNILAFGTSGFNMDGEEYGGVHDGAALTDSIMMISFNQETGDIAMLSLPRDLKASPTCTATGKINEVYWCNNMSGDNEDAGASALMAEVGSILGVDFQYYAHLNWGSLESIVNILGGITIVLDEDINDYYYTGSVYEAGVPYTINGIEAVALSRARHGTTAGDFSRGASQQKILIGIKNKILESNLSITDLLSLASTLGDNLRTNFNITELKTLAHYAGTLDFDSMRQISLLDYNQGIYYMTTGMINGISYVIPSAGVGNYGAIQSYVAEQLSSDPRIYENPSILVLNATDTPGLASKERDKLIAAGYKNIDIDNAPEGDYNFALAIYEINSKPGTSEMLDQFYNQDILTGEDLPANISRDYDFVIILNYVPESEEVATE